jgi:hypothetical protein
MSFGHEAGLLMVARRQNLDCESRENTAFSSRFTFDHPVDIGVSAFRYEGIAVAPVLLHFLTILPRFIAIGHARRNHFGILCPTMTPPRGKFS